MTNASVRSTLPMLASDEGLNRYLAEIKKFPFLSAEKEYMLAKRYRDYDDREAAAELVTSHLRLVAKIAMRYRGYGLPISDLIAEGNVGLMHGVKLFDPDRGFRLATYAMWWIKASVQEFVLRSWSLVKLGTTRSQKKLFYNLRRLKKQLGAYADTDLRPDQVQRVASELGVREDEVVSMDRRMIMGGDASLNVTMGDEGQGEWLDILADDRPLQDIALADAEELAMRSDFLRKAMNRLTDRERHIFTERRLAEQPKTLEELSEVYHVSRERIRQIEVKAFTKVQKAIREMAQAQTVFAA
ncbi:RNA polymerase sigma factor RpoH [Novosphingobium sp. G106]|uniref:RNA polymerase sigma factor RpoH n=1 Tax=Novosphingobium sp. G106 TaxID=2849500 RepID=UPI001C2CD950|nr:RNA polymerase sigma factor RpoH [Novosphingobium sp. G106]MBV1691929.1 RNA polymerase sigma factor RpoH [Novosphingobium sp. G106]